MLILFDHGTPRGLANGALLKAAEEAGFEVFLTTDRRIRYQQNLDGRKVAIVVLTGTTRWSRVKLQFEGVAAAVKEISPGGYREVEIPFR